MPSSLPALPLIHSPMSSSSPSSSRPSPPLPPKEHHHPRASSPEYAVSADDCNAIIAVECVPLDEAGRRGELSRVVVNEGNLIQLEPTVQDTLAGWLSEGSTQFEATLVEISEGEEPQEQQQTPQAVTLQVRRPDFVLRKAKKAFIKEPWGNLTAVEISVMHRMSLFFILSDGRQLFLDFRDARTRDLAALCIRQFKANVHEKFKANVHEKVRGGVKERGEC
ncbi:unnamed protein product [Closterium sp. NIES-65]|nr:unnamed protein product [Closterium sp. NIES-65]